MKHKRGYYDIFVRTCAKHPSRVAVTLYKDGTYKNYTYSELYGVCECITQNIQQFQNKRGVIGLISKRNILIPCVVAAAHKCCTTFMFLDPMQDIDNVIQNVKFTIFIIVKDAETGSTSELFGKKPDKTIEVFDMVVDFFNQEHSLQNNSFVAEHSFIAQTSGSTGQPKHIEVPVQSIQPNVNDLTKMFNITEDDIIYFSTPLTFDPSMIEILLACMNGASLLIAPEKAEVLFPSNKQNSITVWQTTPSKFFQYSNADIKNKILSANSTLKILALGGEPLNGMKRLKELKDKNNKTRIFTLYGVTEMSCWASMAELDLEKIQTDREIPLGNCLSETQIVVEPIDKANKVGEIILVSKTRRCVILNKHNRESPIKIDTGDLGEVKHGTIYYRGRKDDVIKRFGNKVNLQLIESTIMLCPRVKTCSCLWLPKPMLLVVYFSSEMLSSRELSDFLKCKLDDKHWPDKIVRVDNLPTNPHGKVSKLILSRMLESSSNLLPGVKSIFLKELNETFNKNFSYDSIKNKDFFSLGGTSFLAVSMCNKISLSFPKLSKFILPHLLTDTKSIDEILELSNKEFKMDKKVSSRKGKRARSNTGTYSSKRASVCPSHVDDFIVLWTHDTGKCVDASPSLFLSGHKMFVTVGSHSGKIIVADAVTGILQGQMQIKSRVEASVLCYSQPPIPPLGVVGAHDGTLVCFTLENCKEIWMVKLPSMIKSKAVCCNGFVYVAAYDGNIRCINVTTGSIKQTITITQEGISADLVLAKNQFVLVGTLSGVCACVHTETNAVVWRGSLGSPVFASPVLYDGDKYVVFAEVSGEIHCRTVEKGIKIWKYQGAKGNIFSSLYIKETDHLKWQVVFGCHDEKVYSINIKNFQPSLHWKVQLDSQVYSTPCSIGDKIVAVSNNGRICIMDSRNGSIESDYMLPGEVFSSPAVYGDYIFIGCRNDNVYCLKYTRDLTTPHDFRVPE
ncbi:beta-alanine-activating enzyme [Leguminivora glycinivorella]|uniref:beta-alanine-activating enzyme n=1 Tax=Leguminivora glycinivorella TaxID=1035111 RepID=UPI00200DD181|nr:beta-alanine-activating enzyme [Leguminivora glycinivorella]